MQMRRKNELHKREYKDEQRPKAAPEARFGA
jgi:hypothetical protein